ncbi:hypothetical protein HYFRA_00014057 [Hymenoscyphus fraxineus]|uniref:2EXR domain-containing protein n=1 Tax=Hymenoscyphus fraxineus TaxID=746836 RepID=A0A9N9LDD9_9HELO|nr:hypothetical protein HYFRA_00014057 [Hymenoscyphus fraxineus]
MATTRKTQFSDLPSELRSMIWNHAFNTSSQIQTLSIFDTRLYERDNRKNTIASSSSSPTVSPLIPVKSHWSIVSVPKRSLPTALLTCRETWAFSSNFLAGCRESHELLNPASITILQANPEKFYQKTIYSPIPKTTEKKQNFLIKPNEIVHFRPFEQKIRSDSGHTLEITGQDRAMKFFGIKYLAISYTDLYYFKHATPNTVKFHNLQILFVLKPTYQEREDNPCSEDEFEYALRYANTRALRYTTIYPVWQMELDELPLRIIRVDSLEAAGRAVRCINKLEATGWEMSRSVFCVAYKGGPGVSALPYDGPVLGRRTVDYEFRVKSYAYDPLERRIRGIRVSEV